MGQLLRPSLSGIHNFSEGQRDLLPHFLKVSILVKIYAVRVTDDLVEGASFGFHVVVPQIRIRRPPGRMLVFWRID